MIKDDYVSLARVGMFDSGAWGTILNNKCTEGYVVVGYDSDDMQFRVKVRCELVDVIPAPKFKVGDKVKSVRANLEPMPDSIFEVIGFKKFYYESIWLYFTKIPDQQHWQNGPAEDFVLLEEEILNEWR